MMYLSVARKVMAVVSEPAPRIDPEARKMRRVSQPPKKDLYIDCVPELTCSDRDISD
jgi:hypothetical protein